MSSSHTETFLVQGMSCAGCAKGIEATLNNMDGVTDATVNFATATLSLTYDPAVISDEQIIHTVSTMGYTLSRAETHEDQSAYFKRRFLLSLLFSLPLFIISMVLPWTGVQIPYSHYIALALATPVQFGIGYTFYTATFRGLRHGMLSMDSLIALGTSAAYFFSLYALLFDQSLGFYFETSAMIITLILLGKFLEERAKRHTGQAIRALLSLKPQNAHRLPGPEDVSVSAIQKGDHLLVKPGERIPLDGKVLEGESHADEQMITGESKPVKKHADDEVIGGTINKRGSLTIEVTRIGEETALGQIIRLVKDAQQKQAPIQRVADRIASYFVPLIVAIAAITSLSWLTLGHSVQFSLVTGVSVLVIACPCALGLATPTAILVGTSRSATRGILFKSAESLERTNAVTQVIFDKTGTLTTGTPAIKSIQPINTSRQRVLKIAYALERHSDHPIAEAIQSLAGDEGIPANTARHVEAIEGEGIHGLVGKKRYFIGNARLAERLGITPPKGEDMLIGDEKSIIGTFSISEQLKPSARRAVMALKKRNITVHLLTGDSQHAAESIASQLGIQHVMAQVTPEKKSEAVERIKQQGATAMVGDGINDAPALAAADIGIALGSGTDVAMETGDIVIMKGEPAQVPEALELSRRTFRKVKQNLFWALGYNVLAVPIAAGVLYPVTGWLLNPMIAGAAMAFSSVSVVTNSLLLRADSNKR